MKQRGFYKSLLKTWYINLSYPDKILDLHEKNRGHMNFKKQTFINVGFINTLKIKGVVKNG